MNKKLIVTTICLISLYLLFYYLSNFYMQVKPSSNDTEFKEVFEHATCASFDRPLIILQSSEVICESETGVYLRGKGKDTKLREQDGEVYYHPSSQDILVSSSNREIKIEKFVPPKDFILLTAIPLPNNGKLMSTFFSKNQSDTTVLFLAVELTVTSEKENKTKFYEVLFERTDGNVKTVIKNFSTREMLRVLNYYPESELLLFKEMYPFLQEKFRVLKLSAPSEVFSVPCLVEQVVWQEKKPMFAVSACELYPHERYLLFDSENNRFSPTRIEAREPYNTQDLQSRELVAKYSTTIGKRVYNCFDFSESEQITLRSCIPEL